MLNTVRVFIPLTMLAVSTALTPTPSSGPAAAPPPATPPPMIVSTPATTATATLAPVVTCGTPAPVPVYKR